ncbi:transposable element Tcb2 transposase [Trichonephila clavipes]|nr:transposable element Tcb2 transposase [Trichonephila clavipes]
MFSDESRFSLQSDSRRTLIWRAPGAMGAEFLFMDDNDRPHHANIVDECLQSEDITRMDWPAYSPDLNRACVGYAWPMNCSPSTPSHLSTGTSEDIA